MFDYRILAKPVRFFYAPTKRQTSGGRMSFWFWFDDWAKTWCLCTSSSAVSKMAKGFKVRLM